MGDMERLVKGLIGGGKWMLYRGLKNKTIAVVFLLSLPTTEMRAKFPGGATALMASGAAVAALYLAWQWLFMGKRVDVKVDGVGNKVNDVKDQVKSVDQQVKSVDQRVVEIQKGQHEQGVSLITITNKQQQASDILGQHATTLKSVQEGVGAIQSAQNKQGQQLQTIQNGQKTIEEGQNRNAQVLGTVQGHVKQMQQDFQQKYGKTLEAVQLQGQNSDKRFDQLSGSMNENTAKLRQEFTEKFPQFAEQIKNARTQELEGWVQKHQAVMHEEIELAFKSKLKPLEDNMERVLAILENRGVAKQTAQLASQQGRLQNGLSASLPGSCNSPALTAPTNKLSGVSALVVAVSKMIK
jgi:hypothetical protein